jgi:hypothetical protein
MAGFRVLHTMISIHRFTALFIGSIRRDCQEGLKTGMHDAAAVTVRDDAASN